MSTTQLDKLHSVLMSMMKDMRDICERNGIAYQMDGGTFLGAVRHHGFIPWDDDVDFSIPRQEYERFLQVCEKELDKDKYFLQTWKTDKNYCFCFAKIRLQNTRIIEDFTKNTDTHQGIFIDIFPMDGLPEGKWQRKLFLFKNHLIKNMIWVKCGYGTQQHKRQMRYYILRLLGMPFSVMSLKKKREKLLTKYVDRPCKQVFTGDFPRNILEGKYFTTQARYPFEGESFCGPEDFDGYLSSLYGDYMKLPPESERNVHTTYEIEFGPYGQS